MLALVDKFTSFYSKNFAPKLFEVLKKGYTKNEFKRDSVAGLTVAVISIPLSLALAIASGVTPAQGLFTAIVAGFFIAFLVSIAVGIIYWHGFFFGFFKALFLKLLFCGIQKQLCCFYFRYNM